MSTNFDMRLVAYLPLGARLGVLPDLGFTISSTATGPALSATVSTKNLGQIGTVLPKNLEIAVETWRDTDGGIWKEQRDSRFAITNQDYDGRDLSGTVTLTGVGLAAWLLQAAALRGVDYLSYTAITTESALSATISVSGTTWTWSGNPIGNGDRVQIVAKGGSSKNVDTGSIYYARDLSGNQFKLARKPGGTAINGGSASNVQVKRVVTRFVVTGHGFKKSQAVRVTAGSAMGLNDGSTYYIVNPSTNTLQLADKPGGVPLDLKVGSTAAGTIYTDIDGQRVFNNATPGTIMSSVFLEARNRGWGVGSDGSQMTHSWTVGADSLGNAWTSIAADPTTPALSMSFQPGTPATQMLSFLLENKYAEWYANQRTIALVNYGTGNDHSVDALPVRIGRTATSVPVTVDLTAERNSYVIRGYGAVYVETAGTPGPWGVLEDYQTYSGISSKTAATKQATTNIATNGTGQIGYKVTENAGEADFLPTINYSRGDWIAAQVDSDGWTRLRVTEWSYQKTPDGTITVTSTLEYAKRSALVKAIKGTVGTSAGISDAGTSSSPILESDQRKGSAPVINGVAQVARFAADDSATSVLSPDWTAVNADIDGNPLTVINYEVWLREEGKTFGYSIGQTAGLTLDLPPLPSGRWYMISVRAQSDSGQWGELSDETEVLTLYPLDIPSTPTAPTVTGRLGQARVAWDGNLIDASLGTISASDATQRGFAYVQVWMSSTLAGTYTQVGSNMGNAGSVTVSGLSVGSTYYFALVGFNVVGIQSAQSVATSYTIVGVTGPDLVANSVTANTIAAGSITVDKLNVGSVPQNGSPTDRVPQPLTNNAFWTIALGPSVFQGTSQGSASNATSNSSYGPGVTVNNGGFFFLMPQTPVPPSGKLYLSGVTDDGTGSFTVRQFDSTGVTYTDTTVPVTVNGTGFAFASTTVTYYVYATSANGRGYQRFVSAHLFEVISTQGAGQGVELSPAGLQFFDNNGSLAMDLTTNSAQYFGIFDATGAEPVSIASIDNTGKASFLSVSTDQGLSIGGTNLVDGNNPDSIVNAAPNGTTWNPDTPLLDRFPRGVIYDVTWQSMDSYVVASGKNSVRIAQDSFILEDGRQYMVNLQSGGLQMSGATGTTPQNNIYLELQVSTSPITSITTGTNISRGVALNGIGGSFVTQLPIFTATSAITTIPSQANLNSRMLPANVPIYWQLDASQGGTVSASWTLNEFGYTRGLTVIDLGSSDLQRPNGNDVLPDVSNVVQIGSGGTAAAGSGSTGTTASSKTATLYANTSRTWNSGGSSIVTGSGQYTNGSAMYYGHGASDMGSWMGNFKTSGGTTLASIIGSGKTVTAASLTIQNTYCYGSSATVSMGTGGSATAPATIGAPANNVFSTTFSEGSRKTITLSSAIRSSIGAGNTLAFVLGVSGSTTNYSYFHGASQSNPPKLVITYH